MVVHGCSSEKENAAVVCPGIAIHTSAVISIVRPVDDVIGIVFDKTDIPHPIPSFNCLIRI